MPKENLNVQEAGEIIDDCDRRGILHLYGGFLKNTSSLKAFKGNLYKITAISLKDDSGNLSRDSIDSLCGQIEKLKESDSASALDLLSIIIKKALIKYSESNHLPTFNEVDFKNFYKIYEENKGWATLVKTKIFNRALHNAAVNPYTTVGKEIGKIVFEGAPEYVINKCASINFDNIDEARKGWSECGKAYIQWSLDYVLPWSPDFDLTGRMEHYLTHGPFVTDWKELKKFVSKIETELFDIAYRRFEKDYGPFINQKDFMSMVRDDVLSMTREGQIEVSDSISWSYLPASVIENVCDKSRTHLTSEQREAVKKTLSQRGFKYVLNFKNGEEDFKQFDNEVSKLVFDIAVKPYIAKAQLSPDRLSKIESSFLKLFNDNISTPSRILDGEFFKAWVEGELITLRLGESRESSTEGEKGETILVYDPNALPVNSKAIMNATTSMIKSKGGELMGAVHNLTTDQQGKGGQFGTASTPQAPSFDNNGIGTTDYPAIAGNVEGGNTQGVAGFVIPTGIGVLAASVCLVWGGMKYFFLSSSKNTGDVESGDGTGHHEMLPLAVPGLEGRETSALMGPHESEMTGNSDNPPGCFC